MRKILKDISLNTDGMTFKEKIQYIMTYYWYHILGACLIVGLLIFIIVHFGFADKRKEFSCAIINQSMDVNRDEKLASLAQKKFSDKEKVVVDSNYEFSYNGEKQEGINLSLFEKFFIKWRQGEINVVIADKDFLDYCISSGGRFYSIKGVDTGDLKLYNKNKVSGIELSSTDIARYIGGNAKKLVIAFPVEGADKKACQKFIDFVQQKGE